MLFTFCELLVTLGSCFAQEQNFFPLGQYMNMNLDNIDQFLCQKQSVSLKLCNCNEHCFESRTCCIDKLWNNTNPIPLDDYLAIIVNTSKSFKDTVCEKILKFANDSSYKCEEVLMVHSCNNSAEASHVTKCMDNNNASYLENFPVIGSGNIVYRNADCAFCNFVIPYPINLSFECQVKFENNESKSNITIFQIYGVDAVQEIIKNYKSCNVLLNKRESNYERVFSCASSSYLNDRTCAKNSKHYDLCHAYSGLFMNYKNYDCYKCNEDIKIMKRQKLQAIEPISNIIQYQTVEPKINPQTQFPPPFQVKKINFIQTIDITPKDTSPSFHRKGEKTCVDFTYNPLTSKCNITCNYGFTAVGTQCLENKRYLQTENIENANFQNCLLSPKAGLFGFFSQFIDTKAISNNFYEIFGAQSQYQNLRNATLLKWNMTLNSTFLNVILRKNLSFLSSGSLFITSIYDQLYTELYEFDVSRIFTESKICAEPQVFAIDVNSNFSRSCDYITVNKTTQNRDFVMWIEVNHLGAIRKMTTCNLFHLQSNCTLTILENNYVIINKTLIYSHLNIEYKFSTDQFVPFPNGVGVCESAFFVFQKQNLLNAFVKIMFLILTSVSVACYVIIFTTYTYFKELRVISNFNSITLCVYLLLSDCTILISEYVSENKMLCKTISIILHWSFLASYSWILCIAVEMTIIFSSVTSRSFNRIRFLKINILISLSVPTIIVLVNLILEYTNATYIGYGNKGYCWIDGFYARMFSYIFPLSVLLLSSIICLCTTIYKIRKVERNNTKTLSDGKKSRVNLLLVVMKLTLILGATDALGFVQISKTYLTAWEKVFNTVFSVLYTCCRSSKGIMLFMVYICNKKVIQVYKPRFAWLTNRTQQNTSYELKSF